jgi:hypothetical protein
MALVVNGPFVVQASSTAQQPQVDTFGTLKACAASVVNGELQPAILAIAGRAIKECLDDVNIRHLFRFGSKQQAAATLVAATKTYSVPSDFFATQEVQLLDSDGEVYRTLEYIPWGQFNPLAQSQTDTGIPEYWTNRNSFDDENIQVYPTPDASSASDYTLRITYYSRIEQISNDTDIIDAPRELGLVLCTYAEYQILFIREGDNVAKWSHKERLYRDRLKMFMHSTEREPTETLQFRIMTHESPNAGEYDPLK